MIFGKNYVSDFEIETAFDSQIQNFDDSRLMFWILGLSTPISHHVKKNWPHNLTTDLKEGGVTPPPPVPQGIEKARNQ